MADLETSYQSFAADRQLQMLPAVDVGLLTPLLVESTAGGQLAPAVRGLIADDVEGIVGHLAYKRNKTFRFTVALTEVPSSTAFVPRLFCVRKGRSTRDDEFYGFGARYSKLWTESTKLNERYEVTTGPYQDPNWMRQLFSPALVDYLAHVEPADFSFELAYGYLLGSVEQDDPGADGLAALCEATAKIAKRIAQECEE
ncbi:MAG TPA: hypothetical protein VFB52_06680 [Solirubrobacterales bacterium]|nr:hypothetical protein [Solirubrobacterales bacterium]